MAPPLYHAYLLRLWRESVHDVWRVTLEDSATGERQGFANLERFFSHLMNQLQADEAVVDPKREMNPMKKETSQ